MGDDGGLYFSDSTGAHILGTKDSGDNWELVWNYVTAEEDIKYNLHSIYAVGRTAWAVGEYGMIVKYTDEEQCDKYRRRAKSHSWRGPRLSR